MLNQRVALCITQAAIKFISTRHIKIFNLPQYLPEILEENVKPKNKLSVTKVKMAFKYVKNLYIFNNKGLKTFQSLAT